MSNVEVYKTKNISKGGDIVYQVVVTLDNIEDALAIAHELKKLL